MLHPLISERKSIRAFSEKKIPDQVLESLFEAARWAPSSMNEQPWRFILTHKENVHAFQKMLQSLNESNRVWAQHAPVLLLTIANNMGKSEKLNLYAWHDVGLAIGNLSLQATSQGIYLHQMGGFNRAIAKELFEIPDNFEPVSIIALGYIGNTDSLPEHLRERELKIRERKPISEMVYFNFFGNKKSKQ
jgi:nitroreductase